MSHRVTRAITIMIVAGLGLTSCGTDGMFANREPAKARPPAAEEDQGTSILDLFRSQDNPNVTVAVNKYIWHASLEVLDFLPIQSADPFSGLIVTGYGTPPGGRTAYRATILVSDPALDARSLNLSLMTRSGPVDEVTRAAVEDAILTRARQLRVRDLHL